MVDMKADTIPQKYFVQKISRLVSFFSRIDTDSSKRLDIISLFYKLLSRAEVFMYILTLLLADKNTKMSFCQTKWLI